MGLWFVLGVGWDGVTVSVSDRLLISIRNRAIARVGVGVGVA